MRSISSPRLSSSVLAICLAAFPVVARSETAARSETGDAVSLETIEVKGDRETAKGPVEGYVARRTSAGTKTDSSVAETPAAVSTVTRDQMDTQGAATVSDALRYEPGLVADSRPGNRYDTVILRGFGGFGGNANYLQYWDGLRLFKGVGYAVPSIDPYLLERVDIVRGPASSVYGQGNPGGSVDLASKWPTDKAHNEILVGGGSNGEVEAGVDLGGKVTADGALLYRLIANGRRTATETDYSDGRRVMVAPMITWKPNLDTTVKVQATYQRDPDSYYSTWLPALGTLQSNPNGQIPRSFYSGNPTYRGFERTQSTIGYQADHRIDDTWSVRQNFRYVSLDSDFKALSVPAGGSAWAAASACGGIAYRCLARSSTRYVESLHGATLDNQVQADVSTGPFAHKMLFGVDVQRMVAEASYGTGATTYVDYLSPAWASIASPTLTTRQAQSRIQVGAYAQDQIDFGAWHALLGVREDRTLNEIDTTTLASGARTKVTNQDSAFTWRAGLLYRFDTGLSPYVSYSTSFEPSSGTGYGGKAFVPTTGQQYEAGLKYQPSGFDGVFTLSVFDLTQQNVLTTDTEHTSTNTAVTLCSATTCQTQTGEVRSRGLELGGKAQILPGLNLIGAYALTNAEVSRSTVAGVQGKVPVGVPRHSGSLWADYTWSSGALSGLTIGAGARYVGESHGDQTNTDAMRVPERVLFDAAVHYDFSRTPGSKDGWRASVTGTNLADKTYVSACASANQCFYGSGRTVFASLKYSW